MSPQSTADLMTENSDETLDPQCWPDQFSLIGTMSIDRNPRLSCGDGQTSADLTNSSVACHTSEGVCHAARRVWSLGAATAVDVVHAHGLLVQYSSARAARRAARWWRCWASAWPAGVGRYLAG
jgi:hypothetical protein